MLEKYKEEYKKKFGKFDAWRDLGNPKLEKHFDENDLWNWFEEKVSRVELPVKPACENCIHLKAEGGKLYAKTELCQNGKIRLWNLTNCDIDTTEFGCTYFESKSV